MIHYGEKNPTPTWSVNNFPSVTAWFQADFRRFCVMLGDRPEVLAAALGPKQQTWVGGSERRRHAIWKVDAEGLPIWILCSKHGTAYEIEHTGTPWDGGISELDVAKVLRFLTDLFDKIERIDPMGDI